MCNCMRFSYMILTQSTPAVRTSIVLIGFLAKNSELLLSISLWRPFACIFFFYCKYKPIIIEHILNFSRIRFLHIVAAIKPMQLNSFLVRPKVELNLRFVGCSCATKPRPVDFASKICAYINWQQLRLMLEIFAHCSVHLACDCFWLAKQSDIELTMASEACACNASAR